MVAKNPFPEAINHFWSNLRRPWWWVFFASLMVSEIVIDRLAGWANQSIDENSSLIVKALAGVLSWLADTPIGWTVLLIGVVLSVILIHSYFWSIRQDKTSEDQSEQKKSTLSPDQALSDAMDYVAHQLYPKGLLENMDNWIYDVASKFTEKFRNGELNSWGKFVGELTERPFAKEDWKYKELIPINAVTASTRIHQTRSATKDVQQHQLTALRVNSLQVQRTWPSKEEDFVRGFNHAASHSVSTKDATLLLLAQLRTEGVVIRNSASQLYYTGDFDGWFNKVTEWMNDVIEALKSISSAESEWFATLDAVPSARVPAPRVRGGEADRRTFFSIYNQHDFRLARLENLLKKYGVAA